VGAGELEECTFAPRINPAPAAGGAPPPGGGAPGGAAALPFEERVIAWAVARREETRARAAEAAARALEE